MLTGNISEVENELRMRFMLEAARATRPHQRENLKGQAASSFRIGDWRRRRPIDESPLLTSKKGHPSLTCWAELGKEGERDRWLWSWEMELQVTGRPTG